jgi:transmembrane sensor
MLNAGDRVVVDVAATSGSLSTLPVLAVSEREIAERLSWRSPRVEFSNTPLAEVVAFLNRRNQVQFVIEDGALGATALSGLFRADDTDSFVRVMETAFGVKAERSGTQIFLRKVR